MYYKLWREPLIDKDYNTYTYYEFKVCNKEDEEFDWFYGVKFPNPPSHILKLSVILDDPLAITFEDYVYNPIPMVSERLKSVLDACGVSNIDYYPVEIINAEKFDKIPKYYAINVVGLIAAADRDKSEYTEAFGQMGATLFDRFVLNEDAVRNIDLFRLAEQFSTIVVSERIKQACEKANIETLRFLELEDDED